MTKKVFFETTETFYYQNLIQVPVDIGAKLKKKKKKKH